MALRSILTFSLAAILVAPALGRQAQQKPPPDQQRPPVFRAGTNVVQVDVYPSRDGRIVEGLTAADFMVFEDGAPQAIEDLQFVRIEQNTPIDARRDPNTPDEANRLAADPRTRVFVLYLDYDHISLEGSYRLRRPLIDMLHRLLTATDLFGVMTRLLRPQELTLGRRTETIEQQMARHWALGLNPDDLMTPEEEWRMMCGQAGYPVSLARWRLEQTFDTLEGLVEHLGRLREARKVVLLFSRGWPTYQPLQRTKLKPATPRVGVDLGGRLTTAAAAGAVDGARCNAEALRLDGFDSDERLRSLLAAANRNNASFYPVNPAGLETPEVITGGDIQQQFKNIRDRWQLLLTIAENTDGIAVGSNDMAADLRRIVEDVSAYYVLSYTSTNTRQDGRYRRIEVKLRPPGLRVKARRGYLAPSAEAIERARAAAPSAPAAPAPVDEAIAVLSRVRSDAELYARGVATRRDLAVVVELPATRVVPTAGVDVEVIATAGSGAEVGRATSRIEPPGRATLLRLVLPEGSSGPWTVSARAGAGSSTRTDRIDVAPGRGTLAGDPVLFRARAPASAPLQPAADYQFRRTERLHVDWPLLTAIDRRGARLLGRNGAPLAIPVSVTERDVDGQSVVSIDLTLAPLTDADYLIELTVGQAATVETKLIAFRVVR